MSTRPEVLFPLFASLETLPGVGEKTARSFAQMDVTAPRDLLFTLPISGVDRRMRPTVRGVPLPATVTTEVTVEQHHPNRVKGRPYRIDVTDAETTFQLVFFHARADYLLRQLPVGERRVISGKAEVFDGVAQIVHPDHVLMPDKAADLPVYEPVYPLTQGVTQKLMVKATAAAVTRAPDLAEWIDPALIARENWPDWRSAVAAAHAPLGSGDLALTAPVRERLAYDELFAHQVTLALARARRRRRAGRPSVATGKLQSKVLGALPYKPTDAQDRAIREIAEDMASPDRMNRLLQGDVGAGKTLVGLMSLLVAVEAGGQGVMMAPTEILARQHLAGLKPLAESAGVVLEILTGRDKGKERAAKLEALAKGDIQILVGTHAVFQKDVEFQDLRLAIVDEQHRFGVAQRMELGRKGESADVLVMTATPIPRSLSLANYGDMDVSVLDEKPPGRTPVTTALVSSDRMDQVVDRLRQAVAEGRQAYWVCPLVDESEVSAKTAAEERFKRLRAALGDDVVGLVHGQMPPREKDAAMAAFESGATKVLVATTVIEVGVDESEVSAKTAAEERFKRLRAALGDDVVGLVHGQMPPREKDAAMAAFQSGATKVLVATTVIEVGVDVPNASIMVIEGAEGFGLAQMHQLRGRVGRGSAQSTCLLLYQAPLSETGKRRLEILRETEDGFRIAEEDLAIRGAGDVLGTAQSGLPRFRIADLERQTNMLAVANDDARALIAADPSLTSPRGEAVRVLLWLLEQDKAIEMISVG